MNSLRECIALSKAPPTSSSDGMENVRTWKRIEVEENEGVPVAGPTLGEHPELSDAQIADAWADSETLHTGPLDGLTEEAKDEWYTENGRAMCMLKFLRDRGLLRHSGEQPQQPIVTHLNMDPNASPETVKAVGEVIQAAYDYKLPTPKEGEELVRAGNAMREWMDYDVPGDANNTKRKLIDAWDAALPKDTGGTTLQR